MKKRYFAGAILIASGLFIYWLGLRPLNNMQPGGDFFSNLFANSAAMTWADRATWIFTILGGLMILIQFWHDCAGSSENTMQLPKGEN